MNIYWLGGRGGFLFKFPVSCNIVQSIFLYIQGLSLPELQKNANFKPFLTVVEVVHWPSIIEATIASRHLQAIERTRPIHYCDLFLGHDDIEYSYCIGVLRYEGICVR